MNNPAFNKWLDTFIEEKGINLESCFTVKGPRLEDNNMSIGIIVEHIKISSPAEKAGIKDMMVYLDFINGNIIDYFKHLGRAIAL